MADETIQIKRYPNRRYYARNTSTYVSLKDIQEMIQAGQTVEIVDSQSGEDLTRSVLTQIIMEREPEKMDLFPIDMLHSILRSNDAMADFLKDYFTHSLTYLDYLQRHCATATPLTQPMHWMQAWLEGFTPKPATGRKEKAGAEEEAAPKPPAALNAVTEPQPAVDPQLAKRLEELEKRLKQLEGSES